MSGNDVYWRIYRTRTDQWAVVCMQWFDEFDYIEGRFLNDIKYATEAEAEAALIAQTSPVRLLDEPRPGAIATWVLDRPIRIDARADYVIEIDGALATVRPRRTE